jgi:hypothetical protein
MWTCVKCGTKVDPSFDVCWKCGTSKEGVEDPNFVSADDEPPITEPPVVPTFEVTDEVAELPSTPKAELVVCYQALTLMEAKFLADQLAENGIPAVSDTVDMQDALGTWDGNPRVYCRAGDLERARDWLGEYEAKRKAGHIKLED